MTEAIKLSTHGILLATRIGTKLRSLICLIIEEGILSPWAFSRKQTAQLLVEASLDLQRKPAFPGWRAERQKTKQNKILGS